MSSESYYMNLINIFVKYYNTKNQSKHHLFHQIDKYEDTNEMMEEFAEHISIFNSSDEIEKKMYNLSEIHTEDFEKLYGLKINENIVCVCEILIPLLDYIAKEVDWIQTDWKIISINLDE